MADLYEEGHEYVICPECNSHIMLLQREDWCDPSWEDESPDDWEPKRWDLNCDWEPCLADFEAMVQPPRERPEGGEGDDG